MSHTDPKGTVERVFTNGDGEVVAIIKWRQGTGPATVKGDHFKDGQSVRYRNGEVVLA